MAHRRRPEAGHGTSTVLAADRPGLLPRQAGSRPKVWQTGEVPVTPSVDARAQAAAAPAAGRQAPRREPCVLLKLGEIVLKGRNRQQFERLLHTNIRRAARDMEFATRLWARDGVILLRVEGAADPQAAAAALAGRMQDVPGIVRVCHALRVDKTAEAAA